MKFTAVGDYLTQRMLPPNYEGFAEIQEWIARGDARYFNLETTLHREGECYGFASNGGSYLRMEPEVLDDCKRYGFNMVTFCNNHTMDFGIPGLMKTLEHVRNSGLVNTGVGENLDRAAAPAYLETENGRVALIGFTSSCTVMCDDIAIAGRQSRRVMGRPGVNQLRFGETLYVTQEQLEQLQEIARETEVNAYEDIVRAEGYRPPLKEGTLNLGSHLHFRVADKPSRETKCNPVDLERARKAIYEAQLQADSIIVAIHSHQISGKAKENPSQFLEEFARFCIDNGADAVVGHGPHLLRPIEIYKGKPIFYSLGDFILQNENLPYCPEDYYEKYGMTSEATVHELLRNRTKDFTRGLLSDHRMTETVIPYWEMEDGKLTRLELLPVEITHGMPRSKSGLPYPAKDDAILRRLQEMSAPYGTKIEIVDGIGKVVLDD